MSPNTDSPEQELKPLSVLAILAYSIANLGYGMFFALNNAIIPLFLKQYTPDARIIGLMSSSHSFEGAFIQPIVGSASDRLRTRYGRRRPFMLVGVPISALFLLLTPAASHLPGAVRLIGIIACIFLFTVSFNIAADPYQALMPDIAPNRQRGRVSGFAMFVGVLGQAAVVQLRIPLAAKFFLTALVMCITTAITCLVIQEKNFPPEDRLNPGVPRTGLATHFAEMGIALRSLKTLHQAGLALAGLFFAGVGIGAILPFLTLFVQAITHCNDDQAQRMFLYLMLGTAVGVLPFGWLADRIGAKRVLMIGLGMLAVAAFFGLRANTLGQITILMWLAGFGNAAQSASSYPLLTQLVPSREVGFFTGLQSTALSIATPLTGLITGELVNKGGYQRIFAVCAVSLIIALIVLSRIDLKTAKSEILTRDIEQGRDSSVTDSV